MAAQPEAAVPTPDPNNTPMCIKHALFLHTLSPGLLILAPILFTASSVVLTQCIRRIAPGVTKNFFPHATTTPAATTTGDIEMVTSPSAAPSPGSTSSGAGTTTNFQASTAKAKRAKVQYDYAKAEDNEINLGDGEYVLDIEMVSTDWWMGTNLKGERGLFPSNYVEIETLPPVKPPASSSTSVAHDAPPPYAPSSSHPLPASASNSTPVSAPAAGTNPPSTTATTPAVVPEPQKPKAKRRTAGFFVLGTALVLPLLFSIFLLALSIQAFTYCAPWSPISTLTRVFCWLAFCFPAIFASCGISCYAMLVRDLWGKKAKKKFKIDEGMVMAGLFFLVFGAVLGPILILGMGAVKCVEGAQRAWCGDVLVEDDEEEGGNGRIETGELRHPEEVLAEVVTAGLRGAVVDGENGEGSEAHVERESEEHSENVGLIKGMEM